MTELFTILGKIAIENGEANSAMDETADKAKSFSEKLSGGFRIAGTAAENAGKKFLPLSTAVGGVGAASGKMALDFTDSMADINTLLDDDSHLQGYKNAVKSTSRETGLDVDTMAKGMYQAISSLGDGGKETEKIFHTMARSAKAGGAEVSDSVALISAGMKGYNSVNDETAMRLSDLAFQTAKLGVTTFPEMARSMQPLFPLSSSLNLSYEELFGSMATLTGVTGNTAEVSTQLKAVFSNLMKPTTAMGDLIAKYGYSSGQAMLESEGFAGMLKIVQNETGGQADKMAELFSSTEAVTAMTALTGAQFDSFNYKLSEMGNATGATQAAYDKLDTSGDKLRRSWNNMKVTGLELGEVLIDTLVPVIEKGAEKVGQFSEWFASLDDGTKKMIVTVGGFLAAAGPMLIFLGKVSTGIGSLIKVGGSLIGGIGKLGPAVSGVISIGGKLAGGIGSLVGKVTGGGGLLSALAAIPGPVWIVIGIFAALVAAGVLIYKNWDEIKEWGQKTWASIQDIVGKAVDGIKGFLSSLGDFLKNNWQGILTFIVNPIAGGLKLAYDNCEGFREKADVILEKVKGSFDNFGSKVSDGFHGIYGKLSDFFQNTFADADGYMTKFGDHAWAFSEDMVALVQNKIEIVITVVKTFFSAAVALFTGNFSEVGNIVKEGLAKLRDLYSEKLSLIRNAIHNFAGICISLWEDLTGGIAEKANRLKENAVSKFNELKEKGSARISELKESAISKFNELKERASDKIGGLKDDAVSKFNELREKASEKIQGLKERAVSKFEELRSGASEKIRSLQEKGIAGFEGLRSRAVEKFGDLKDKVTGKLEDVKTFVSKTVEKLKGFFKFDWSLPKIKLPHFSMEGKFSLDPPSIPRIGVEWYKKAMDNPVLMEKPTAFGINAAGQVMAGGEAGSEVVSGTDTLMGLISAAVAENNGQIYGLLDALHGLLARYLPALADKRPVVLDSGALVGELAGPMNEELGRIVHMRGRWN